MPLDWQDKLYRYPSDGLDNQKNSIGNQTDGPGNQTMQCTLAFLNILLNQDPYFC